jgi:hypothetical protein
MGTASARTRRRLDAPAVTAGLLLVLWLLSPRAADAYIGPGAGITVIGTAVAFVSIVVFAIIGFVWYPIKRLRAAFRSSRHSASEAEKAPLS